MKRLLNYMAAVLAVGYLVVVWFVCREISAKTVCPGVEVRILDGDDVQFIRQADVERTIARSGISLKERSLATIDTEEVENMLYQNRLIRNAQCYKTPSGMIRVDVTQRNPILRVFGTDGSYYVDENGEIMPTSAQFSLYLPVATGAVNKAFAREELFRLARFLQNDAFWNAQVEQIHVRSDREILLVPRVGKSLILLGRADHLEEKFGNLMALYEQALPKVGWNKYETINLKYLNQVVCTRRE